MEADASIQTKCLKVFRKKKVLTIPDLVGLLDCSSRTVQRRLKTWQALSSCNHNGRYYTLPEIPQFDCHGLWHYRGICFSKHGNLNQTLVHLVRTAEQGLSAAEIGELLRMNPQSLLSHFREYPELHRERIGGRFIWFAADPKIRNQQKQRRAQLALKQKLKMPSDMEAVLILVDLLHHPDTRVEQIARRIKHKGGRSEPQAIRAFLEHHDLSKKTPRHRSCDV